LFTTVSELVLYKEHIKVALKKYFNFPTIFSPKICPKLSYNFILHLNFIF
jgi:hypothetical protein